MNSLEHLYNQINMIKFILAAVIIIAVFICLGIALYYRRKSKTLLDKLNTMLDKAIAGDFEEGDYDESKLSKTEAKLGRFLSSSNLKKNQIQQEQNRIKTLISDISHQTKTPVANIVLYSQLLCEQDYLKDDGKDIAMRISTQADKLNFLIQSLIKVSRLESGIITIAPTAINICQPIEMALSDCMPRAESKDIKIEFNEPETDIFAMTDPKWSAEAISNIIDNGVKYTDIGGTIHISISEYPIFIRIDIVDSGMGIKAEDTSKIFGRFWRAKDALNSEGVGIGLFLSREIIMKCGGYIKVSSEYGEGSIFSVFLPKA